MNKTGTFDLLETEENVTTVSRMIQYSLAAVLDSFCFFLERGEGNKDGENNEDEISRK